MSLVDMLGSKIVTFGPKSGWPRSSMPASGVAAATLEANGAEACGDANTTTSTTRTACCLKARPIFAAFAASDSTIAWRERILGHRVSERTIFIECTIALADRPHDLITSDGQGPISPGVGATPPPARRDSVGSLPADTRVDDSNQEA